MAKIRLLALILALALLGSCAPVGAATERPLDTAPPLSSAPTAARVDLWLDAATPGPTLSPRPSPSPTPEPTPSPTPEPTPSPTPTPAPTKDPNRPMIALTFDDGPNLEYTPQVLDLLEEYGIKGTFFVIGSNLSERTRPILQRMADMGCDIGMHGLTHTDMTRFSAATNASRFEKMRKLISDQIEGGYDTHLLRPPFGSLNKVVRRACKAAQVASIRWSVDTLDWSNKNPATIMKYVQKGAQNGRIILFHDRLGTTVTALEQVIPWLLEEGYDLVTVTELIESSGEPIVYGEDYQRKPGT